ncbi:MAG: hypothetical protein J6O49_08940 [Bacteroidaceae bacterium]|nr:hypothetical protein [Bacteroidaceae bacterium]
MMFNNSNGYSLADIAAATGNGNNGNNDGFFNGDGAWILLLFILILAGGWGNGYGGFGGGNGAAGTTYVTSDIQRGFDQSAIINSLTGIANAVNSGFSGAEISRCNAQANILQTLNNNQGNLSNQLNTIAMNQQNCCCENRAGLADLKYTVATEACADRTAVTDALRDVIASNTANTQAILDKLCQQEIDALKTQNQQLQMQSYLASLAASQNAQTGQILNDNAAQTTALLRALNPAPIPAYVVANPYGCNCANSCGCGGNGFFN